MRGVRGTDERPPVGRLSVAKSNRKKKNKDLEEENWMRWRENEGKQVKFWQKRVKKLIFEKFGQFFTLRRYFSSKNLKGKKMAKKWVI